MKIYFLLCLMFISLNIFSADTQSLKAQLHRKKIKIEDQIRALRHKIDQEDALSYEYAKFKSLLEAEKKIKAEIKKLDREPFNIQS